MTEIQPFNEPRPPILAPMIDVRPKKRWEIAKDADEVDNLESQFETVLDGKMY